MTLGGSFLLKLAPSPALEFQTQLFILVSPIFLILNSLVLTDALFGALALAHTPRPLRLLIVRLIGSTLKKQTAPLPGMAPGGGFEGRARGGGGARKMAVYRSSCTPRYKVQCVVDSAVVTQH